MDEVGSEAEKFETLSSIGKMFHEIYIWKIK